jgi:hypothetical protein
MRNPREITESLARKFFAFSRASHLPAFNPHLTKTRLNDAQRLCEMLLGNFFCRGIKRKTVEPFRAQGE